MRIIFRYLSKEVLYTMLGITSIAVFIFVCNQFVRYLGYVASGKYAASMLIHLVLFYIPILFALLLPLGLFLGILLGYGRLYADSEMTVLMACGFSRRALLKITLQIALLVLLVVTVLVMLVNPIVAKYRDRLMDMAETNAVFQTIVPGRFQSSKSGDQVFYIQGISLDRKEMSDIFMAQKLDNSSGQGISSVGNWMIISAKSGHEIVDEKTGDHFLVVDDGYRYEGTPGEHEYRIVKYKNYGVRLSPPIFTGRNEGEEILSMKELFRGAKQNPNYMAELQWRLSMPISVIVLALLALPLSRVNPRHGRFAQLLPAIIVYIIYANMLFASRSWLENGSIPSWIGLWWTHLVVLLLALWLLLKNPLTQRKTIFSSKWLR